MQKLDLKLLEKDRAVAFLRKRKIIAKLFLDHVAQIQSIVFFDPTIEEKRNILILAANHVLGFVRSRFNVRHLSPLVPSQVTCNRNLTAEDSSKLFNDSLIGAEIRSATDEELMGVFMSFKVGVVDAVANNLETALYMACSKIAPSSVVTFQVLPVGNNQLANMLMSDFVQVEFSAEKMFEFWNSMSKPGTNWDLDVVPAYHPVMTDCESTSLINGDTDANIRGLAVTKICPPENARIGDRSLSSWEYLNHPCKITGTKFTVTLSKTAALSQEGIDELTLLLSDALRVNNRYIAVDGGFCPPYPCGHNRLIDIGKRQNWPHEIRGSEAHCLWTYRVLESEGQLENSYIPEWFEKEGWLEVYASLKEEPQAY